MDKHELVRAIIQKLRDDLVLYQNAAGAARAEATDEQSKAENKYDTRGLEASYLARGQSRQAAEINESIKAFQKLALREFSSSDAIDVGAVVELKNFNETSTYFIGPRSGGTEIACDNREVLVITPESPLGSQLVGRRAGENCMLDIAGQKQQFKVVRIW